MLVSILLNEVLHEGHFATCQRVANFLFKVSNALVVNSLCRRQLKAFYFLPSRSLDGGKHPSLPRCNE